MKTKEGLWKLSPSGLYTFEQCKACFWIEQHHGRAPSIPFVLNSAMDSVLKSRYDLYRSRGELPPEVSSLAEEGIEPFLDIDTLNRWRGYSNGLDVIGPGYILTGKVDDVLLTKNGHFIPTDYKTSGYMPKPDKQKYYVSQLNGYGLMLQASGRPVFTHALLLHYFIKDVKNHSLNVEFSAHVDPVNLDLPVFELKLESMVALLNGPYPGDGADCATCAYHVIRNSAIL